MSILSKLLLSKNKNQKIKKIALLISTNYINSHYELNGCSNDTKLVYKLLIENFNFKNKNINLLTDYTIKTSTKINLINIFNKIIKESYKIDTIFIYFSGHGNNDSILLNTNEKLFCSEFRNNFLMKISKNTKIIIIFDCCKSGNYVDTSNFISNIKFYILNIKILFISACNQMQNTTEIYNKEKIYYGIFTYFLCFVIKKYRQISWSKLIYIVTMLINKINKTQKPQIKSINYYSLDNCIY